MRYTEYVNGIAVIKDQKLIDKAIAQLAQFEDEKERTEEYTRLTKKFNNYCNARLNSEKNCMECILMENGLCKMRKLRFSIEDYKAACRLIDEEDAVVIDEEDVVVIDEKNVRKLPIEKV